MIHGTKKIKQMHDAHSYRKLLTSEMMRFHDSNAKSEI